MQSGHLDLYHRPNVGLSIVISTVPISYAAWVYAESDRLQHRREYHGWIRRSSTTMLPDRSGLSLLRAAPVHPEQHGGSHSVCPLITQCNRRRDGSWGGIFGVPSEYQTGTAMMWGNPQLIPVVNARNVDTGHGGPLG